MFKRLFFYNVVRNSISLLNLEEKRKSFFLIFLLFINGVVDVFGLSIFIPLVSISVNHQLINSNHYLNWMYLHFNFSSSKEFLVTIYIIAFVFFVFKVVNSLLVNRYLSNYSWGVYRSLSSGLFHEYFNRNYIFHTTYSISEMIRDIFAYPLQYVRLVIFPILTILSELIVFFIIIISIIIYDYRLFFLLIFTLFPIVFFFYKKVKTRIVKYGEQEGELEAKLYDKVMTAMNGYVDVKILNKEKYFEKNYLIELEKFSNVHSKSYVISILPAKIIELASVLGVLIMLFYYLFFSSADSDLFTIVGIYIGASYRLIPSINKILSSFLFIKQYAHSYDILKQKSSDISYRDISGRIPFESTIEFKDVKFRYDKKSDYAINKINLTINKGETIGIIGRSGSGKTTLMNLLLRFYQEELGDLLIDNKKITEENASIFRKLIGYVRQDVCIINGTIAQNIAFGIPHELINKEKINSVIVMASLHDFVESLPLGINTFLGEKGARLSGGQKQRIAIARALYFDAEILLFDEATSALDTETEDKITESINSLGELKKTIIIIAHRYSTLKNCDVIYRMDNGTIVEKLSFEELITQQ